MLMNNPNLKTEKSNIEGCGLFTKTFLHKGDVVVDYRTVEGWYELDVNELNDYQIRHNWIIMKHKNICETTDYVGELNYMNHSRTPNCEWFIKEKYIIAARDILEGEELTIDYRLEERSNRKEFPSWI